MGETDRKLIEMVGAEGFSFGPTILREADRAGLSPALALALVEQESGFRNIFGCDLGPRDAAPWCHQEVTRDRVKALISHVSKGGVSNGVGLTQLTSIDFIRQAEAEGGAHKADAQCRVGFRLLRGLIDRNGERVGIGAYNGGEGNPNLTYADSVLALRAKWRKRIDKAVGAGGEAAAGGGGGAGVPGGGGGAPAAADVHRDLRLTDPFTEGADVKALQRGLNEIHDQHEQLTRPKLDDDGVAGRKTFHAARRCAFIVGLGDSETAEIGQEDRISERTQSRLRDPSTLSEEAEERGAKRREELRKKLANDEPDFNGQPTNVTGLIEEVIVAANKMGLFVTSTTGGGHTATSHHFPANSPDNLGHAVDLAATTDLMVAFQKEAVKRWPQALEIFGPANSPFVKNGLVFTEPEGTDLENLHDSHVHVAR